MKAARVRYRGEIRTALQIEDGLLLIPESGPSPVDIIVADGWERLAVLATEHVERDEVDYLAPVERPSKLLGIGLNYQDHADEQRLRPPSVPAVFPMFASSVTGPGDAIPLYPITAQTDYEAELGAIIGPRASHVAAGDALEYVAGYTIVNDVTARDLQSSDAQWVRGKALDGYAPMGPVIVSPDEFGAVAGHRITCEVNGEVRQDSDTGNLIFDLPALIAHISEAITLEPGDVIATGTPSGVGHFMDPPRYLEDGDVVTIRIEGIGELSNPVARTPW